MRAKQTHDLTKWNITLEITMPSCAHLQQPTIHATQTHVTITDTAWLQTVATSCASARLDLLEPIVTPE